MRAYHQWDARGDRRRQSLGRLVGVLVLALALVALGMHATAPTVHASSDGTIQLTPTSGPVGTHVDAELHIFSSAQTQYVLRATTTDPQQNGCDSVQPIPGVGTVTINAQGGDVQFDWPGALSGGPYWLCALPATGSGELAVTLHPFTVLAPGAPTPTAPPQWNPAATPPDAAVDAPANGVVAGAQVYVIVNNWTTANNTPPTAVKLVAVDAGGTPTDMPFTVVAVAGTGSFDVRATLPQTLPSGRYAIQLDGAYHLLTTNTFQVVALTSPTPTATATPVAIAAVTTTLTQATSNGSLVLLLGAIIAAVVVLGLIAMPLILRRRRES